MKIIQFLLVAVTLFLTTNKIIFSAEIPSGPPDDSEKASQNAADGALGQSKKTLAPVGQEKKSNKKIKVRKKRRRRCSSTVSPSYRRMLARWRKKPQISKAKYREGLRDLVIYSVNTGDRVRFFPYLPNGELDSEVFPQIEHTFRDKHTDAEHPLDPRLIMLLYKIADRFKVRQINVISGYRESVGDTVEGNHSLGRATDIMIPGTKLGAIAYYARTLGHVGVGFYPTSGFVHLDVRKGPSFYWVDRSGPGKPSCLVRIQSKFAVKMDRRWKPGFDKPRRHKNKRGKLLGAIETKKVL